MTAHYDSSRNIPIRCDGDHEWGDPYLEKSSTDVVLKNGDIHLQITWTVLQSCQKEHTENINNVHQRCQKTKVVDEDSKLVPVEEL